MPYVTLEALEELTGSCKKATPSSGQVWSDIKQKSPSEEDLEEFFANLSTVTDRKPAILSVVPTYNKAYATSSQHLPPIISDRYDPQNLSLNYHQLIEKTETVCQQPLTESQIMHLEEVTRDRATTSCVSNIIVDALLHHNFIRLDTYQVNLHQSCTSIHVSMHG